MKKLMLLTGLLAATTVASAQTEVTAGVTRGKEYGVTCVWSIGVVLLDEITDAVTQLLGGVILVNINIFAF